MRFSVINNVEKVMASDETMPKVLWLYPQNGSYREAYSAGDAYRPWTTVKFTAIWNES